MGTLITVKVGDKVVGRCDARCYMAKHDHCDCCCGGRNHGVGLKKAIEQTRGTALKDIKIKCERVTGSVSVRTAQNID